MAYWDKNIAFKVPDLETDCFWSKIILIEFEKDRRVYTSFENTRSFNFYFSFKVYNKSKIILYISLYKTLWIRIAVYYATLPGTPSVRVEK